MSSLVILSADPQAADRIREIAEHLSFRVRMVSKPEAAREWISMQSLDVLLVDARYGEGLPLDILSFAWKHHPALVGGIFNPYGEVEYAWPARLAGAEIFSGPGLYEDLTALLRQYPRPFEIAETERQGILIVEDLDSPRDIICSYVESLGYAHVRGASCAQDALALLNASVDDYFCVITDIKMPGASGIELIDSIRSSRLLERLPVIVLTSIPTSDNLLGAIRAGATGFLVKPPKKKSLRRELEKAKRIYLSKGSARLCSPEEAVLVERALSKLVY